MTSDDSYDVLVVGAGPSGLTTAAALARFGVRVLVVEKHPGLSIFPKAIGVRPRSMEIFRSWGLEPEIRRRSHHGRLSMWVGPALTMLGQEVSLGLPDDDVLRAVSPATVAQCGQDQLEAVLLADVRAHGGEVRFRTELVDVVDTSTGVEVTLRARESGDVSVVSVQYLVGADGARSLVRSLTGIDFEMLASEGSHLSVLFRADLSAVMPDPPYILTVVTGPEAGLFASTAMPDRWVWDMEWHPETSERVEDWTPERIVALLRRATGLADLEAEVIGVFPWDFGAGVANAYQRGRVLLVGDAAHRTTPRGATGMNTGIADAHNLGWKLAWVINGWAAPALLESYEAERGPVGRHNASASLVTMMDRPASDGLAHDFAVSYRSGAVVGSTPLAGHRAPHAWTRALSLSKSLISTLDLFDGHFTLITGPDAAPWRSAAEALAAEGVPLAVFSVGIELEDPSGELMSRYSLGEQGCVLVRPDGFVAWGSDEPTAAGLRDALRLATGHRVAELVG